MADETCARLSLSSRIGRVPDLNQAEVDGDVVVMSVSGGEYYCMNETCSEVWKFLSEERTVEQILRHLLELYDVEKDRCEKELVDNLQKLLADRLIAVVHGEDE